MTEICSVENRFLYVLQKVVMADAGDYRCRAKNIYGEVTSSTFKTQIRRKFTIIT
jgi:hypothetical protein